MSSTGASGSLGDAIRHHNESVRAAERWRTIRTLGGGSPRTTLVAGPEVEALRPEIVHFASNDYLGLSQHPAVLAAAVAAIEEQGTGSGASRLVVGGRAVHLELEHELADWTDHEAALLFPTGFAANMGVIGALVAAGGRDRTTVFSDELNHASIIDGIRAARAQVQVYSHNDPDALADALAARRTPHAVVVTDLVFSMDGDVAPVAELAAICATHDALLVLDEAHAVLGPVDAAGIGRSAGCEVVTVGTLSKTLGSLGGFVAASRDVVDLCVNTSRSFIFSTAPPPATAAAALAALRIVRSAEGDELRSRLRLHVERIRPDHPSPIVPVVLGSEEAALTASSALLDAGLLVPAIRPPTVPVGTSRLRVALSAVHSDEDVDRLATALATLDAHPIPRSDPRSVAQNQKDPSGSAQQNGVRGDGAAGEGRPALLVAVAGTGTEVGKTWVAAAVARQLINRGLTVSARKPAQSFEPADVAPGGLGTDADHLAAATGEDPLVVCPPQRRYEVPMAPPMAAHVLGRDPITIAELAEEVAASWTSTASGRPADVGLVELAGGTRSPAAHDGDGVDLARALRPDLVVLVADAGLGTVHAVRSALDGLGGLEGLGGLDGLGDLRTRTIVHLNRFDGDDLQCRNRDRLLADGCTVTTDVAGLADAITARRDPSGS